jgi:hypothetical protein
MQEALDVRYRDKLARGGYGMNEKKQASSGTAATEPRLGRMLRALPPAPEAWVKRAQEIPRAHGKATVRAAKAVMKKQVCSTLLVLVLAAALAPAAAQAVSFTGPTNFPVDGTAARPGAAGDFNRDGRRDLAVAHCSSGDPYCYQRPGRVSILLGNGDGGFAEPTSFPVGLAPSSVAVADFNGDSNPDVAVANIDSQNVSILLGNGHGTFSGPNNFPAGSHPTEIAAGDFDHDGNRDLAVANYHRAVNTNPVQSPTPNVSILLGNGDGAFQNPSKFVAGDHPTSVAIGDFNEDGVSDLALGNALSNNVSLLLGTGTGAFSVPVNFDTGTGAYSAVVGDFDGDGHQDVAVATYNSVSVLRGTGTGALSAPIQSAVGGIASSARVGEFDGDGKPDLAVVNFDSDGVSVLLGTGSGSFSSPAHFVVGATARARSVVVSSLNGDTRPDLAAVESDDVSVLLNTTTVGLLSPSGTQTRSGMSFVGRVAGNPVVTEARFWVDLPIDERQSPHHDFSCWSLSDPGDCQDMRTDYVAENGYFAHGGFFGGSAGEHTATVQLWRKVWGDDDWVLVGQDHRAFTYSP